jgi:hypothetical protein
MINYNDENYNSLNERQKSVYAAKRLLLIDSRLAHHHQTSKQFIYSLTDPITKNVRYVGQTGNPQRRYAGHLYNKRGLSKRVEWIESLKKIKLKPEMIILEELSEIHKTKERERRWIFHFAQQGCLLLQSEFFMNPHLMKEIFLTKKVNFLTTNIERKFWKRLFLASILDFELILNINSKYNQEERSSIYIYEEVRKEYELLNNKP